MTAPSMTVRPVETDDLDRVEALLEANDLPARDVRSKPECFVVAVADAAVIGVGGVEIYGSNALLRSVVVTESNRGRGYGTALVDSLEGRARKSGVASLYLLTTTASAFFRSEGYEPIDRERVPTSIRRTTEFADLCPASATCLRKTLER